MENLYMPKFPYAHRPIQEGLFIFPITGLQLAMDSSIFVGNIQFVDKKYLLNNIIDVELALDFLFTRDFDKVKTFAIVDLSKFGNYKGICKDGNNSLALQILKQTIGAVYLSMFIKRNTPMFERRIIISNKAIHEVDEGLNPYMAIYNGKYMVCPNDVDKGLVGSCSDFEIQNIEKVIEILSKDFKEKSQYEQKICKTLEIIYSIYNESYSRERILKWAILLNYIFREDNDQKIDSNDIGRKLRILFNIIEKKEIFEKIPKHAVPKTKKIKDISKITVDINSRVRNDLMHGKIELYTEYAVCNLEDLIILKTVVMELLIIMCKDTYLENCKTTKDFNLYIENKEKENIENQKKKKL